MEFRVKIENERLEKSKKLQKLLRGVGGKKKKKSLLFQKVLAAFYYQLFPSDMTAVTSIYIYISSTANFFFFFFFFKYTSGPTTLGTGVWKTYPRSRCLLIGSNWVIKNHPCHPPVTSTCSCCLERVALRNPPPPRRRGV